MRNKVLVILIFLLTVVLCSCVQSSNTENTATENTGTEVTEESFYGNWVVTKCIPTDAVSMYNEEEIQQMIGQRVSYTKDKAVSGESTIKPYYRINSYSQADFITGHKIYPEAIGIDTAYLTQILVYIDQSHKNGWESIGSFFYIKDPDTLIIFEGGVFLEMKRVE